MPDPERPHLYLDTGVVLDELLTRSGPRPEASRDAIQRVQNLGWRCSFSVWGFMEIIDALHEEEFLRQRLEEGMILSEILRRTGSRRESRYWIGANELSREYDDLVTRWERDYPFIDLLRPSAQTFWEDAQLIAAYSNLGATDAIHLATAYGAQADLLICRDEAFIGIVSRDVPEEYQIPIVLPDRLDDGLRECGFQIDSGGQAHR